MILKLFNYDRDSLSHLQLNLPCPKLIYLCEAFICLFLANLGKALVLSLFGSPVHPSIIALND